jgi:hypothetical protein
MPPFHSFKLCAKIFPPRWDTFVPLGDRAMYITVRTCAVAIAISMVVGACSMPMTELLRDVMPGNGNPTIALPNGIQTCIPTNATWAKLTALTNPARQNTFFVSNALSLSAVNDRLQNLPNLLHPDLRNEPVVREIVRAVGATIYNAQVNSLNLVARIDTTRGRTVSALLAPYAPTVDDAAAALNYQPRDLNYADFISFGTALRHAMVESAAPSSASIDANQFAGAFVYYFKSFINGKYYTRFGESVAGPPAIISFNGSTAVISVSNSSASLTVTDAEIAGSVQVFLELIMDYALGTPVWWDAASPPTYYPGKAKGNNTPTVVLANRAGFMPLTLDKLVANSMQCGIDPLKAEAIHYIAKTVGNDASQLAGVVGGSFGGINVGLGVLGKVSIGDNKTIHDAVTAGMQTAFARAGEEASWRALYWIGYPSRSTIPNSPQWEQDLVNLIRQYLSAQLGSAGH